MMSRQVLMSSPFKKYSIEGPIPGIERMFKSSTQRMISTLLESRWNWLLGLRFSEQIFASMLLTAMPKLWN